MNFWKERDKIVLMLTGWLPKWVKPNYVTAFRLVLILPLIWLLIENYYIWAVLLALFAYFTDMVDGALARSRKQISNFGKLADPVADKAVYFLIFLFIAWGNIDPRIIFFMIVFEMALVLALPIFWLVSKIAKISIKETGANVVGKFKTPVQVAGVVILAFSLKFGWPVYAAEWVLWLGVAFAAVNLFVQIINPNNFAPKK
ncbi:CDP-alcohol phosphatidyltransferase family protein [Patescibacteria group bacterium]|nr:CDP-alcohol phosphatidyltransferase family protein [Patescibacteria group bacterium]MBU1673761.1 CDP-alcohol phosphatidyltransferase family protein [Patescibacteria group bacterium]MBU1964101.1 CDP-alcohol phosphatidyltransferase family protein [Patescibacteria group bacterium]